MAPPLDDQSKMRAYELRDASLRYEYCASSRKPERQISNATVCELPPMDFPQNQFAYLLLIP